MFVKLVSILSFAGLIHCAILNRNYTRKDMEGFIVGGQNADIRRFPHAAYLSIECVLLKPKRGKTMEVLTCGSSILNQAILLTAAHCLHDCHSSTNIKIKVGKENMLAGNVYDSDRFIEHPGYNPRTMVNDIALIKIKGRLQFSNNVKRVVLLRYTPQVSTAYVSGWGLTDEKNRIATAYLKYATQTIMSHAECMRILPGIPEGTFCGKGSRGLGFAAQGDSGSGLIANEFIVIGLVSFKFPDTDNELAVYTDVSHFYDWILKTSKSMFCGK